MRRLETVLLCIIFGFKKEKEKDSENNHWDTQELTHSYRSEKVPDPSIRESHELDTEAENSVPEEEVRSNLSIEFLMADEIWEDEEKDDSFKKGFEKGRGEVGYSVSEDGEWSGIRRETEEFSIKIIPDPPESESDGQDTRDLIRHEEEWFLISQCVRSHRDDDPDDPTMETHPSFPHFYNLSRMSEEIGWFIKNHIPKASPEDNPEEYKQHERINILIRKDLAWTDDEIPSDESERIHEPIPARSYMDAKEGDRKNRHGVVKKSF